MSLAGDNVDRIQIRAFPLPDGDVLQMRTSIGRAR
jgi:hypothetical protein